MEIKGRFNIRTKDGHSPDECKSAMQKYARRGDGSKMFYAVQQLNSFCEYDKADRETVMPVIKAIRTNMINRLSVILFEDVSYRSLQTFKNVCKLIDLWKRERTEIHDGKQILKQICFEIANAKKARQPSYLRNFYGHRTNRANPDSFMWIYQNEQEAFHWLSKRKSVYVISYALHEWKRLRNSKRESDRFVFLIVPALWIWNGWDDKLGLGDGLEPIQEIVLKRFDEFVYDIHTRKGKFKTKQNFVSEGAVVLNEDSHAINFEMKRLYEKQLKPVRSISIPVFCNVRMITEGLCGGKMPCFFAFYGGTERVVKPFGKSLNFGLDYAFVDSQKHKFGIPSLNVKLIHVENLAVEKLDERFVLNESSSSIQVFAVMDVVKNKGDLGKNKEILTIEDKFDEMLKIRLFNGLFRTSDNILRNILVDDEERFVPIDENDILGKREKIFNAIEPIKQSKFWTNERIVRLIQELRIQEHKESILSDLCLFELQEKRSELEKRLDSYETIVMEELN
jgi:hypothetical protein